MSEIEIDNETLPLWRILLDHNVLEESVLFEIYDVHLETGKSLYRLLISNGLIAEADLLNLIAEELQTRVVDLKGFAATQ